MSSTRIIAKLSIVTAGGLPPSEFCIFRAGEVRTTKGTFIFDKQSASSVMAEYREHGIDLMIDYDHFSLSDTAVDPSLAGRAAGWCHLEVRNGELWATKVRWTEAAADALQRKEWRFMSPAFGTKGRRIVSLLNVAITNLPATRRLTPLMAASATKGNKTMKAPSVTTPIDNRTEGATDAAPRIAKALGASGSSGPQIEAAYARCSDEQRAAVAAILLGYPNAKRNVIDSAVAKFVGGLAAPRPETMPTKAKAAPPPPDSAADVAEPGDDEADADAATLDFATATLDDMTAALDALDADGSALASDLLTQLFGPGILATDDAPADDAAATPVAARRVMQITATRTLRAAAVEVEALARERIQLAKENAAYSAEERLRLVTSLVTSAKRAPATVWRDSDSRVPKDYLQKMSIAELRAHLADEIAVTGGRFYNPMPPKDFEARDAFGNSDRDLQLCKETGCDPATFAQLKRARDAAVPR